MKSGRALHPSKRSSGRYIAAAATLVALIFLLSRSETSSIASGWQSSSGGDGSGESRWVTRLEGPGWQQDDDAGANYRASQNPAKLEYAEDSIPGAPQDPPVLQSAPTEDPIPAGDAAADGTAATNTSSRMSLYMSPPYEYHERNFGRLQDDDLDEVLQELAGCTSVKCIIRAHDKIDGRTRFNMPHFMLIGWQKCATTSVNAYLRYHPQYLPGLKKEPHWFSVCQSNINAPHCEAKNETQYLRDFLRIKEAAASKLEFATLDASADYAQKGGPLARRLYRLFPWLKVVIMIREPISRIISYTRMHTQQAMAGREWKGCNPSWPLYSCLKPHFVPGHINSNYSEPLSGWLRTFPTRQIFVIQFEELQENPAKVLFDLKVFLGLDPEQPDRDFYNVNSRQARKGYPIKRGQYQRLVRMVKDDSQRVAEMLDQYGLANQEAWLARWRATWDNVLQTCDFGDNCEVDSN